MSFFALVSAAVPFSAWADNLPSDAAACGAPTGGLIYLFAPSTPKSCYYQNFTTLKSQVTITHRLDASNLVCSQNCSAIKTAASIISNSKNNTGTGTGGGGGTGAQVGSTAIVTAGGSTYVLAPTTKQQTSFDTTTPEGRQAYNDALNSTSGQISVNDKQYTRDAKTGNLVDPSTNAWSKVDPDTGQVSPAHSSVEFTSADGTIYHGVSATPQEVLNDDKTLVSQYDKDGKLVGVPTPMGDAVKSAATETQKKKQTEADGGKTVSDECQKSYNYARDVLKKSGTDLDKFRCNPTNTLVTATQISNTVLTTAGTTIVNQLGANAANQVQSISAIPDSAAPYRASASMAKTSFTYETALGMANVAATYILSKKAALHRQNSADIEASRVSAAELKKATGGGRTVDDTELNAASTEQAKAGTNASTAAFKTAMVAAQSLAGAVVAKTNQSAAEANARMAHSNDMLAQQAAFQYNAGNLGAVTPPSYAPDPGATSAATASTTSDGSTTATTPLGTGNDAGSGASGIAAPDAGKFTSNPSSAGGGAAGGGGAPAGGGGGGAAPGGAPGDDAAKAAYASEFASKERFETGGGIPGAGAKNGAAGKAADPGIDLNGLLAQFLPKGAEDGGAKNGILDAVNFRGNRGIASEEAPSYLDKNADLFQRIHETMSEKNRRGQLGI